MKNSNGKLKELKSELEDLECNTMVNSFAEQKLYHKKMFLLSREIEKLENPKLYNDNISHWENYENRF